MLKLCIWYFNDILNSEYWKKNLLSSDVILTYSVEASMESKLQQTQNTQDSLIYFKPQDKFG